MTHRIISSDYPARVLEHVKSGGAIIRTEQTSYRGPVAFIGAGRVWGVATLRDVKPANPGRAKDGVPAPQGYLWCFEGLQQVEAIPCATYAAPGMFQNGKEWEPLFLQASAQAALNALLSPESGQEQPQMASGVSVPTQAPQTLELAGCGVTGGQMELF